MEQLSTQERFKRGAADSGRYFEFMSEFIGFTPDDAATIRETRFVIEKYIPSIVADFYAQLLRYPATRRLFLKKDSSIDQPYLEMRMHHQAGFWRRTASGVYATQDGCTHVGGPLSEGELTGKQIVCPWHASCFDVTNGQVECGPAKDPLRTFHVTQHGDILRVEAH